ncbi:MAG TPA: DUF2330 domain-containing protein, partial [Verrucomicrobiae bacterium]|nr:DUF2330 domain-containing protein [Verrucomicrobiae bacterium]
MRSTNWMRTVLLVAGVQLLFASAFADGCFVFRWDKKTDINEPTQKAVILHHAGREDLLLQVKFEGSVDEFGWLIPVPSLPTVERGSMDAFYELSQLTQEAFGGGGAMMGGLANDGESTRVKVIEIKTVGAYRISILSAHDAAGLENWLKENGYSIPGGPTGRAVVDDYIKRGWFFVAAKIDLSAPTARKSVQQKLASGELHPLLISFETPECIFPLKISSVAGKPSEVSLYVISEKPLLNRFVFDEARANLENVRAVAKTDKAATVARMVRMAENSRVMALQSFLYSQGSRTRASLEDLQTMVRESAPPAREPSLDEEFGAGGILHCMSVKPEQITKASRSIPRLKNKKWYLTKVSRTFAASEMRDLEFESAVPALGEILPTTIGPAGAFILAQLGPDSVPVFINACRSENPTARKNGAIGLARFKDPRVLEPLRALLQDKTPEVRLQAARAAGNNWDVQFVDPMIALFRDPNQEIRTEAIGWLAL